MLTVAGTRSRDGADHRLTIRADSVELGDIGELIQANVPFGGLASVTREHQRAFARDPRITIDGSLDQPRFGDVRLDRATFGGSVRGEDAWSRKAELFRRDRSRCWR